MANKTAEEVMGELIGDVARAKDAGVESVSIDQIRSWLNNAAEKMSKGVVTDDSSILAEYQIKHSWGQKMFDAVHSFGTAAIKSGQIINGGAAIALLAFIGNIWGKETSDFKQKIGIAMLSFVIGTLLSSSAYASAYFSQANYHMQEAHSGSCAEKFEAKGDFWRKFSVGLVVASFISFLLGGLLSYQAIL